MTTHTELHDLETRPKRYWNIDGTPELVMGVLWIAWGAAFIVGGLLPEQSAARTYYWMVVPLMLVLTGLASNQIMKWLKERFTFPRTGYVESREPGPRARVLTALIAMVSACVVAALVVGATTIGFDRIAAPATGALLSLSFVVAAVRQRAPQFLALALVALALGLALAIMEAGLPALSWMFLGLGVASASLGVLRLRRYLKAHPVETEA